ncbi:MAG: hypothetical protein O2923_03780 [Verrucomicrobia bacterium]|nr:hypothetical protein [Verrucomicrobiota bacterium]
MYQAALNRVRLSCLVVLGVAVIQASVYAGAGDGEVSKGDDVDQVLAVLGEPKGVFQKGDFVTYVYDRGVVDIVGEEVVFVDLMSEADVLARKAAQREAQAERALRQTAQKQKDVETGHRIRAERLADKSFDEKPASERLAYWLSFQRRYAGVDVSTQIAAARAESRGQAESSAQTRSIEEAKTRIRSVGTRLGELDQEEATSKTHWKRGQINRERAVIAQELVTLSEKLIEFMER